MCAVEFFPLMRFPACCWLRYARSSYFPVLVASLFVQKMKDTKDAANRQTDSNDSDFFLVFPVVSSSSRTILATNPFLISFCG